MNITEYIPSKDMRKYLNDRNYPFTPQEAVYVIYEADLPLSVKIDKWHEVLEEYNKAENTDSQGVQTMPGITFPSFMEKYIDLQKRKLASFLSDDTGQTRFVFSYSILYKKQKDEDSSRYWQDGRLFSTYKKALESLRNDYLKERKDEILQLIVNRTHIDEPASDLLTLDADLNPVHVWLNSEYSPEVYAEDIDQQGMIPLKDIDSAFCEMDYPFPRPFKPGDVLRDVSSGDVFVASNFACLDGTEKAQGMFVQGYTNIPPEKVDDYYMGSILKVEFID